MNRILCGFAAMLAAVSVPAIASDVGVSVHIGEPGFYGRIDIGNVPRPQLIYPRPVLIQPVPVGVESQPIYLRVPPGHAKHWGKHCAKYNACGQRVYFVQDRWYNNVYVPHYRKSHGERHGDDRGKGRDRGHGKGKGHKHD